MDSRRYKKLLKAQTLIRQRDQALLSAALLEQQSLEAEKQQLVEMSQKTPQELFIDHLWVVEKLKKNAITAQEKAKYVANQQKYVHQANHRCDILLDKQKELLSQEERKAGSILIGEYLTVKKNLKTSLA